MDARHSCGDKCLVCAAVTSTPFCASWIARRATSPVPKPSDRRRRPRDEDHYDRATSSITVPRVHCIARAAKRAPICTHMLSFIGTSSALNVRRLRRGGLVSSKPHTRTRTDLQSQRPQGFAVPERARICTRRRRNNAHGFALVDDATARTDLHAATWPCVSRSESSEWRSRFVVIVIGALTLLTGRCRFGPSIIPRSAKFRTHALRSQRARSAKSARIERVPQSGISTLTTGEE